MSQPTSPLRAALHVTRAATLWVVSLLATSALADGPKPPQFAAIIVAGDCIDGPQDTPQGVGPEVKGIERSCVVRRGATMSWKGMGGAASYAIDVWTDQGEGFEYEARYQTHQSKVPLGLHGAERYLVTLSSIAEDGAAGDPSPGILLYEDAGAAAEATMGVRGPGAVLPPMTSAAQHPWMTGSTPPDQDAAERIAALEVALEDAWAELDAAYDDIVVLDAQQRRLVAQNKKLRALLSAALRGE